MGKDTRNLIFANISENIKHKIPKRKSTKLFTRKIFNSAVLKVLNAVNNFETDGNWLVFLDADTNKWL